MRQKGEEKKREEKKERRRKQGGIASCRYGRSSLFGDRGTASQADSPKRCAGKGKKGGKRKKSRSDGGESYQRQPERHP